MTDTSHRTDPGPAIAEPATAPVELAAEWPYIVSPRARSWLRGVAVFGVVVALVGTIVVWQFLGDLDRNTDRSLVIGEEAATTLVDTVDVADGVVAGLDDGLATLEQTLEALDLVITSTVDVASSTATLAEQLPDRLDEIDRGFASLQSIATTVDTTLSALSDIPFGPDYNPDSSFAEAIVDIRASLDPLQADLDAIATELSTFADGSGGLQRELSSLSADVANTRRSIDATDDLLGRYRQTAEEARALAVTSRSDLDDSMTATRWVVIAVGLLLALSQLIPWTLADLRRTGPMPSRITLSDTDSTPTIAGDRPI